MLVAILEVDPADTLEVVPAALTAPLPCVFTEFERRRLERVSPLPILVPATDPLTVLLPDNLVVALLWLLSPGCPLKLPLPNRFPLFIPYLTALEPPLLPV